MKQLVKLGKVEEMEREKVAVEDGAEDREDAQELKRQTRQLIHDDPHYTMSVCKQCNKL